MSSHRIALSALIIVVSIFLFNACKENPGEFTLGEEFIESQTDLTVIDTFSVSLSTVILDSVITSGTGNLLVGSYRDNIFGKITSHSYFQLGVPATFNVENDERYDSLTLAIKYNKYSFGDTTRSQRISVHQLTENIEPGDNAAITSKTSFSYNPISIGSIIYTPKPNGATDTLAIRISDDLGFDLFTKLKDGSEILADNESFINYFHGLMLIADEAYDGSIIGFTADDVKLILSTSRASTAEEISYEFTLEETSKQFNHISHDFASTRLSPLVEQRNELPSANSGGLSFLQGGIGLAIRVDFPSLQEILLRDKGIIMQARLAISPLSSSYNEFGLPSELILCESDKQNRSNAPVYDMQGSLVYSTLTLDELYHEETVYLFDVTKYLNDELADSYIDPAKGLLITLPSDELTARFSRLIIDAKNQNTELKIYFLSY